jgi:hypothetical protein
MIIGVSAPGVVKPLVAELSTKIVLLTQGLHVLFYRAALPLSHQTLTFVSDLIRAHRRQLGSPWHKLNGGQQALLVLVYLRKGKPFAEVGAGFAVSTTTCWRHVNETVELLAQRAPKLRQALREAQRTGMAYVIIDGTLIPIDRIAADRPFYSAVMIFVCYLGPWLDPYSGWPCCLVFDLSAAVGGGACCRRSGGACPDRGLAVQGHRYSPDRLHRPGAGHPSPSDQE